MTISAARRLIVGYAAVLALFDLAVLLPGNPITSAWGLVGAVLIQVLILWRLWLGSSAAWLVAMVFAAGFVLSTVLMGPEPEAGLILTLILAGAQVAILGTLRGMAFGSFRRPPEPLRD